MHQKSPRLQVSDQQPKDCPQLFLCPFSGLYYVAQCSRWRYRGVDWTNNGTSAALTHCTSELLPLPAALSAQVTGDGIALRHTEFIIILKCWNLAYRKFVKNIRASGGLAKVEGGGVENTWNPAILSSNEDHDSCEFQNMCAGCTERGAGLTVLPESYLCLHK